MHRRLLGAFLQPACCCLLLKVNSNSIKLHKVKQNNELKDTKTVFRAEEKSRIVHLYERHEYEFVTMSVRSHMIHLQINNTG